MKGVSWAETNRRFSADMDRGLRACKFCKRERPFVLKHVKPIRCRGRMGKRHLFVDETGRQWYGYQCSDCHRRETFKHWEVEKRDRRRWTTRLSHEAWRECRSRWLAGEEDRSLICAEFNIKPRSILQRIRREQNRRRRNP